MSVVFLENRDVVADVIGGKKAFADGQPPYVDRAHNGKPQLLGDSSGIALINEREFGMEFVRKHDGFAFAKVKPRSVLKLGNAVAVGLLDLNKGATANSCGFVRIGAVRGQFIKHTLRNVNAAEQLFEQVKTVNFEQRDKWRGV